MSQTPPNNIDSPNSDDLPNQVEPSHKLGPENTVDVTNDASESIIKTIIPRVAEDVVHHSDENEPTSTPTVSSDLDENSSDSGQNPSSASKPRSSAKESQKRVKTGSFERHWTLARASLLACSRLAARTARAYWNSPEERQHEISEALTKEANYLVEEIGKLKGSVVKVGQLMALWGEHYLPNEINTALHQLEDQSAPLEWSVIEACLWNALGPTTFNEFDFDPQPVAAASFGQVHRARRRSDGADICFKIQYPGVADSIEADLAILTRMLRVTRMIKFSRDLEQWMSEVTTLLRNEVNYDLELAATQRFYEYLKDDSHYHVPKVIPNYSSRTILASTFEQGIGINSPEVKRLSQERRNKLAILSLSLFWREIFDWGEMQTDTNFGNYFVRIDPTGENDELVLLDFGAIHRFDPNVLRCGHQLVAGTYLDRPHWVESAIRQLGFLHPKTPQRVYDDFYRLCRLALEPFLVTPSKHHDEQGRYNWLGSNLINRILSFASQNALSTSFQIPPRELMYISRKIIGAYTLMALLDTKVDTRFMLKPFIDKLNLNDLTPPPTPPSVSVENHVINESGSAQ